MTEEIKKFEKPEELLAAVRAFWEVHKGCMFVMDGMPVASVEEAVVQTYLGTATESHNLHAGHALLTPSAELVAGLSFEVVPLDMGAPSKKAKAVPKTKNAWSALPLPPLTVTPRAGKVTPFAFRMGVGFGAAIAAIGSATLLTDLEDLLIKVAGGDPFALLSALRRMAEHAGDANGCDEGVDADYDPAPAVVMYAVSFVNDSAEKAASEAEENFGEYVMAAERSIPMPK